MEQNHDTVKKIVEAVLQEIGSRRDTTPTATDGHPFPKKQLLLLISGGLSSSEDAQKQLELLHKCGYGIRVLFTRAGRKLLGEDWVKKAAPDA
jgi:hypothetical protein